MTRVPWTATPLRRAAIAAAHEIVPGVEPADVESWNVPSHFGQAYAGFLEGVSARRQSDVEPDWMRRPSPAPWQRGYAAGWEWQGKQETVEASS